MQAKKTLTVKVEDSKGREVNVGDQCNFLKGGMVCTGLFVGIDSKGLWQFVGYGYYSNVEYKVHPKSIESLVIVKDLEG